MSGVGRWPRDRVSDSVVVGSISIGGDYSVHCWCDPMGSRPLFSVPCVVRGCLPDFLVMIYIKN